MSAGPRESVFIPFKFQSFHCGDLTEVSADLSATTSATAAAQASLPSSPSPYPVSPAPSSATSSSAPSVSVVAHMERPFQLGIPTVPGAPLVSIFSPIAARNIKVTIATDGQTINTLKVCLAVS